MSLPCIVIPCYIATPELQELTINTIRSMRRTSKVFIIAVDDGSPMDTGFLEKIADATIHKEENTGFAKTCNDGIKFALDNGFKFIGVANNDIEVYQGWIEALLYPFSEYEDCGITGLISSKERHIDGMPIEKYQVPKLTSGGLLSINTGVWMQSGGLLMASSKVWNDVGLYDEQFVVGGEEDVDLFHRCMAKYQIIMSGYSCFWHKEGATRWNNEIKPSFREYNKAIEEENYDKFEEKWGWDIRKDGLHFYEEVLE